MLPATLRLREARADDAETIRAMVRRERLDPTQLHWQQFLIVEHGDGIVAVGQLRQYGAVQELGSLVVDRAWRGQGLGQALIEALVKRRSGELYLECRGELASYYEKAGFVHVSWREVPWPLKAKFAFTTLVSRLVRRPGATMRYAPDAPP